MPSFMSSLVQMRPKSVASWVCASSKGVSRPWATASSVKRREMGPLASILRSSASASASSLSFGTTRFTRPMRSASWASTISPV